MAKTHNHYCNLNERAIVMARLLRERQIHLAVQKVKSNDQNRKKEGTGKSGGNSE